MPSPCSRHAAPAVAAAVVIVAALVAVPLPDATGTRELGTTTGVFSIASLSRLDISGDLSNLLTLGQDESGDSAFNAGYVESAADATMLTIHTDDAWDLSAKLAGEWSCPGTYDKTENDLYLRITNSPTGTIRNGARGYVNLDLSDKPILSHASAVASNTVDIQTRVLVDWANDVPGAYSLTITYTLVTHLP